MLNYAQKSTVIAMGVFLSSVVFPSYLTSSYHSIVYAAVISCGPTGPGIPPCNGTEGDDNMKGDSGRNSMNGLGGNDQLSAGPGHDGLHGGYGDDTLNGGPGNDVLYGSVGADSFRCGAGDDRIDDFTESAGDTKSNDCEVLWSGNATLSGGGLANDTLSGFPGNNTLSANNSSSQ